MCCDRCEEWFHGTCVGVTRARGKEMEENEEDYICPVCIRKAAGEVIEAHRLVRRKRNHSL